MAVIRLSPQDDGKTVIYMKWDYEGEDYKEIDGKEALKLMAKSGTIIEVAMNHPTESMSHFESRGEMRKI